ncbi:hypothetical protein [Streptomyces sp. NRRL S-118]|uniref:hypothetical protein n=1 Tax=Streptomyces sp. NRRL S-118 TaxID=1463881 RepID=UPI0018FE7309|nr:hypothetical protein [Streptomyces sp. NRRL S-118]
MTQSGQGQEPHLPAARPAHEGVVLPAEGGETWAADAGAAGAGPAGGQAWGGPWGPPDGGQQAQPGDYGQPRQPGAYQQYPAPAQYPQQHAQPPQAQPPHGQQHQQPPHGQQHQQYGTVAQPLPPEMPTGAAAAPAGADADATQYIPPVAGHPGPVAPPAGSDAEATQYLPPVPPQPTGAPYGIRPGTPDERQPPAEFDSLFRSDAGATQHMPRYGAQQQYPQQHQHQQYEQPYDEPQRPAPRRSAKVTLITAVVVGCAAVGLGAGALLSGGGDDSGTRRDTTDVAAATSPAPRGSGAPAAADPVRTQAEALDKLLAESNDSRAAVIRSVENIKRCKSLDQAATDLLDAAKQRRGLVTKLQTLQVDKLPDHTTLTASLTKAWQASASADDHYAIWAKQVDGKKGCKDGQARTTSHTAQANRASGEATAAKQQASALWNKIATTYGLTLRQPTQL